MTSDRLLTISCEGPVVTIWPESGTLFYVELLIENRNFSYSICNFVPLTRLIRIGNLQRYLLKTIIMDLPGSEMYTSLPINESVIVILGILKLLQSFELPEWGGSGEISEDCGAACQLHNESLISDNFVWRESNFSDCSVTCGTGKVSKY